MAIYARGRKNFRPNICLCLINLGPSPCSISSDKSNETKDDGNGMAKKQGYVLGKTAELFRIWKDSEGQQLFVVQNSTEFCYDYFFSSKIIQKIYFDSMKYYTYSKF